MGDSGGPIVYKDNNDASCLIGVDIYGDVACNPTLPNVFIRAEVFHDWIYENIITLSTSLTFDASSNYIDNENFEYEEQISFSS